MADVKVMNGEKLLVQIGDGAGPEVFAHDCLINTDRGIQFSSDITQEITPTCDTPEDPAWKVTEKDGLSATVTGAGKLHTSSVETWFTWFKANATKNVRIKVDVTAGNGGGYWAGAFHLTAMEIAGTRKGKATVSVTLVSSGPLTWTDAS